MFTVIAALANVIAAGASFQCTHSSPSLCSFSGAAASRRPGKAYSSIPDNTAFSVTMAIQGFPVFSPAGVSTFGGVAPSAMDASAGPSQCICSAQLLLGRGSRYFIFAIGRSDQLVEHVTHGVGISACVPTACHERTAAYHPARPASGSNGLLPARTKTKRSNRKKARRPRGVGNQSAAPSPAEPRSFLPAVLFCGIESISLKEHKLKIRSKR